jgi:hypothetical protein
MPDQGFDTIFNWLDTLEPKIKAAAFGGLEDAAFDMESDARQTVAYRGMSGATRASTIAYVATTENPNQGPIEIAYEIAASLLDGFTGHMGAELLEDSGVSPGSDELVVILTVPTDYIDKLEFDNGGEKAFLGDTLHAYADNLTVGAANAIKQKVFS